MELAHQSSNESIGIENVSIGTGSSIRTANHCDFDVEAEMKVLCSHYEAMQEARVRNHGKQIATEINTVDGTIEGIIRPVSHISISPLPAPERFRRRSTSQRQPLGPSSFVEKNSDASDRLRVNTTQGNGVQKSDYDRILEMLLLPDKSDAFFRIPSGPSIQEDN